VNALHCGFSRLYGGARHMSTVQYTSHVVPNCVALHAHVPACRLPSAHVPLPLQMSPLLPTGHGTVHDAVAQFGAQMHSFVVVLLTPLTHGPEHVDPCVPLRHR